MLGALVLRPRRKYLSSWKIHCGALLSTLWKMLQLLNHCDPAPFVPHAFSLWSNKLEATLLSLISRSEHLLWWPFPGDVCVALRLGRQPISFSPFKYPLGPSAIIYMMGLAFQPHARFLCLLVRFQVGQCCAHALSVCPGHYLLPHGASWTEYMSRRWSNAASPFS